MVLVQNNDCIAMKHIVLSSLVMTVIFSSCIRPDAIPSSFKLTPGDAFELEARVTTFNRRGITGWPYLAIDVSLNPEGCADYDIQRGKLHSFLWPSDDIWLRYGKNSTEVKRRYKEIVYQMEDLTERSSPGEWYSTVFARGSVKVVADKTVNGLSAGTDLTHLFENLSFDDNSEYATSLNIDDIATLKETLYGKSLIFFRPKITSPIDMPESVTFIFSIPVRRVMFLRWIDDCINNPLASPSYVDDELCWEITVN